MIKTGLRVEEMGTKDVGGSVESDSLRLEQEEEVVVMGLKFILVDQNVGVCRGWRRWLSEANSNVEVRNCALDQAFGKDDNEDGFGVRRAIVSPGNSFGYLGGGFDLGIQEFFGGLEFEGYVREHLGFRYRPVGQTSVIPLSKRFEKKGFKYLIHAPTVVTPIFPFDASRSIVACAQTVFDVIWNLLESIPEDVEELILPGLGTGYVGIPPEISTISMAFAVRLYLAGGKISQELKNVLIMLFLDQKYRPFIPDKCRVEAEKLGLNWDKISAFDVRTSSLDKLLPMNICI
ncbi:putative ADP-ribose 1''-phosphate phosphatase Ecym_7398 [Eremothecium cymbalariae DBVPG|uniref:Macro domain-containing protein n=1 Tax=Eremothecium cymbalariae (strain CBS 270.75 / DBVPG 7215 / KCTC 17166 / NRRL Y-17582) TaxID=931890 RepID=G8JWK9_ERECY|nr:hypothetical protein Ecym_7398 [Eremothecium cymbalariae DBVPG\